jgi:hypothetical protein
VSLFATLPLSATPAPIPACPRRPPLSYHTLGAALMKALRFAASVLIIAAILALYRTLLPVFTR